MAIVVVGKQDHMPQPKERSRSAGLCIINDPKNVTAPKKGGLSPYGTNVFIKDNTCHACPVACKKMVEVHINGKAIRFESYEYESAWALGAHSGHTDTDWTGYTIYLCNAYGIGGQRHRHPSGSHGGGILPRPRWPPLRG